MTNEREWALEAARRIVEQRRNPVNIDLFTQDADTVARALLSAPEWQTIDSAPREPRAIIGTIWHENAMMRSPFITFWSPSLGKFFANPTHWIPLPAPPASPSPPEDR